VSTRTRRSALIAMATAGVLLACPTPARSQFTSYRHDPRTILEGHWQSCPDPDGTYAERVYDHVVNGIGQFEVHLGPHNEFAIFRGVQDEHRNHASPENLLIPYRVPLQDGRGAHRWLVPALGVIFNVTLAGGSFADCDSWYISLQPSDKPSH
jgi:hypothetical protein